jgi:hypothetical protein
MDSLKDLLRDEMTWRNRFGDETFEAWVEMNRREAQALLLGRSGISIFDLTQMYGVPYPDFAASWERIFNSIPLRVVLTELPQLDGASAHYKQEVERSLREFQSKYGWIIDPLLVPVALQVVIRPPPKSRQRGLHDLDNVLRDYLIPKVIDVLKPLSHVAFTFRDPNSFSSEPICGIRLPRPPASTRIGLTRYEAWRLPPAQENARGFVSVTVVADTKLNGGIFYEVDEEVHRWKEAFEYGEIGRHRTF